MAYNSFESSLFRRREAAQEARLQELDAQESLSREEVQEYNAIILEMDARAAELDLRVVS